MFRLLIITVFMLIPVFAQSGEITKIQKDEIFVIADSVKMASEMLAVNEIMKHLARDVVIKKDYELSDPVYDYERYEQYITKTFRLLTNYRYARSNESFETARNGKDIIFKMLLNEKYEFQNKEFSETHQETWWLRKPSDKYEVYQILIQN